MLGPRITEEVLRCEGYYQNKYGPDRDMDRSPVLFGYVKRILLSPVSDISLK